jgi:hypothetical protein
LCALRQCIQHVIAGVGACAHIDGACRDVSQGGQIGTADGGGCREGCKCGCNACHAGARSLECGGSLNGGCHWLCRCGGLRRSWRRGGGGSRNNCNRGARDFGQLRRLCAGCIWLRRIDDSNARFGHKGCPARHNIKRPRHNGEGSDDEFAQNKTPQNRSIKFGSSMNNAIT